MENINLLKLARKPVSPGTLRLEIPVYLPNDSDALFALLEFARKVLDREEKRARREARHDYTINQKQIFIVREFVRGVFDMVSTELARARDGDA